MEQKERLQSRIIQWKRNLLCDGDKHSSDYENEPLNLFGELHLNLDKGFVIPDIEGDIKTELCLLSGLYCEKATQNKYVFTFPQIMQCEQKEIFALQILKIHGKFKVDTYAMPMLPELNEFLSNAKLDSKGSVITFVKECKHHVHCYYIRQEQYKKLQKFVAEIRNCIVHGSFGYNIITLECVGVEDKENNIFINLSIILTYFSAEVRPYQIEFDFQTPELPNNVEQRLDACTNVFKKHDLSVAVAALINDDKNGFLWKRNYEETTLCSSEMSSSADEFFSTLSNLLPKQRISSKVKAKTKNTQRTKTEKRKITAKPSSEETKNAITTAITEKNIKSQRKDISTTNSEQNLSAKVKIGKGIKKTKQIEITTMLKVKAPPMDVDTLKNRRNISQSINTKQMPVMKKQNKTPVTLQEKFCKSKSNIDTHDDVSCLSNKPSTLSSQKIMSLRRGKESQLTEGELKTALKSLPDDLDESVFLREKEGNNSSVEKKIPQSDLNKKLMLDAKTEKNVKTEKHKTIPTVLQQTSRVPDSNLSFKAKADDHQVKVKRKFLMLSSESSDDSMLIARAIVNTCLIEGKPSDLRSRQTILRSANDVKQRKRKISIDREFVSRNFMEVSDTSTETDETGVEPPRSRLCSPVIQKNIPKSSITGEQTRVRNKPFTRSRNNAPLRANNLKQMLQDRATSTPLRNDKYKFMARVTDFEISSISTEDDSVKFDKLWKKGKYKAKKREVKETDAQ